MIKPTVGRVVWYQTGNPQDQPNAAIVAYVYTDRCVNLMVINANGDNYSRQRVFLRQDDDLIPDGFYAEWMPYQKGQAAKTEGLQAELDSRPGAA